MLLSLDGIRGFALLGRLKRRRVVLAVPGRCTTRRLEPTPLLLLTAVAARLLLGLLELLPRACDALFGLRDDLPGRLIFR